MRKFKSLGIIMLIFSLASSGLLIAAGQDQIELVPWKKLADFFIEITGWEKNGEMEGAQLDMSSMSKSHVVQPFVEEKGDRRLEVVITDTAKSSVHLMPYQILLKQDTRTAQEYTKTTTVKDFPAVKMYNFATKEADLVVLIAERYLFELHGHLFSEEQAGELEEIAALHDLEGIATQLIK